MSRRQRRERQKRRRGAGRSRSDKARLATATGISLAAALGAAPAAEAEDFTVTTLGDPTTGTCDPGDCSLRQAVAASEGNSSDDRILFQAGLSGTIALGGGQGHLYASQPLEVLGPGAGALAVDADASSRVFNIFSGVGDDVTISGLTVTGGDPSGSGGGIYSRYADLTIRDSTISGNDASGAGAGVFSYDGTLEIVGSTVSENDASFGGGVSSSEGSVTIKRSTLSGNGSTNGGGGLNSFQSTTTVDGSTFTGNEGGFGGGLYVSQSALTIEGSTIANNNGHAGGGGVWSQLHYADDQIINNTIIAGNTAVTGPDLFRSGGAFDTAFSLIGSTADATLDETVPGSNITGQSPQLGPLADNGGRTLTRALLAGSPALDKGSASGTDQRGLARPFNLPGVPNSAAAGANGADIGAYELRLCAGVPVNRFGTAGADKLRGTARRDGILGLGGPDRLFGLAGPDALCGGGGRDLLRGGKGRDRLLGQAGRDRLIGGPGRDRLRGGPGRDRQRQ
jgi:CSLREA domain-containing protein